MKNSTVVKIDDKEFTIKELSLREIIAFLNESKFLGGSEAEADKSVEEAILLRLNDLPVDVKYLMEKCCDFTLEDLYDLHPSEIRKIIDAFKEINKDFLSALEMLGVTEAVKVIRDVALNRFSGTLVGLLNRDI